MVKMVRRVAMVAVGSVLMLAMGAVAALAQTADDPAEILAEQVTALKGYFVPIVIAALGVGVLLFGVKRGWALVRGLGR